MARRLIVRQQVIDAGEDYCGKCKLRTGYRCDFFGIELWQGGTGPNKRGYMRDYLCLAAEQAAKKGARRG